MGLHPQAQGAHTQGPGLSPAQATFCLQPGPYPPSPPLLPPPPMPPGHPSSPAWSLPPVPPPCLQATLRLQPGPYPPSPSHAPLSPTPPGHPLSPAWSSPPLPPCLQATLCIQPDTHLLVLTPPPPGQPLSPLSSLVLTLPSHASRPPFVSSLVFELWELPGSSSSSSQHVVRVLYNQHELQLPDCLPGKPATACLSAA